MKTNLTITDEYIVDNSIFRIGKVFAVEGQLIKIKVDKGKNTSSVLYKGTIIQNISVGGYVKIKKGFSEMIGKIEGESITEDKEFLKIKYKSNKEKINRILSVKILGFIENGIFNRGKKELPLIDNICFLLRKEEFEAIHDFVKEKDKPIEVGSLQYDDGQKIRLGINSLFTSHIGIFGNTGSGKSYTLAKIYRELFLIFKDNLKFQENANFFLIDFNGEYVGKINEDTGKYISKNVIIEEKYKNIYELTTGKEIKNIKEDEKFPVHETTLKDSTFWSIFLSATEKTQMPFLDRAIKDTYIEGKLHNNTDFKNLLQKKIFDAVTQIDKKTEKSLITDMLNELFHYLDKNDSIKTAEQYFRENYGIFQNNGKSVFRLNIDNEDLYSDNTNHIKKIQQDITEHVEKINIVNFDKLSTIKRIGLLIIIKYYDEMIRGFSNREHLSPLIKRLDKRILDLEKVLKVVKKTDKPKKNFTIVSLRKVNLDIRKMIPMLLVKELYDKKRKDNNKNHSLHIIIDEAHNILSQNSDRENEQWKDYRLETFEEVIKEGRKFGTFLTIASQRPSDISPTIISQLHNYFLHRLINNNDLLAVEKTIAYLDKVSADSISDLPTGTCILAGLIAQIPVVMKVNEFINEENAPQSQNIDLLAKWKTDD